MVQRVKVSVVCDVHAHNGEDDVEAVFSEVIAIGSTKRRIELCAECRDQIVGDLPDKLRKYGAQVESYAAPAAGSRKKRAASASAAPAAAVDDKQPMCTEEGCSDGPFKGAQGLSMHITRAHRENRFSQGQPQLPPEHQVAHERNLVGAGV